MQRLLPVSLTPVPRALEIDVEVEDAALERAPKPFLRRVLPLLVDDLERNVLVRGTGVDAEDARLAVLAPVRHDGVRRSRGLVDEIGVEDVELVPLHPSCGTLW